LNFCSHWHFKRFSFVITAAKDDLFSLAMCVFPSGVFLEVSWEMGISPIEER